MRKGRPRARLLGGLQGEVLGGADVDLVVDQHPLHGLAVGELLAEGRAHLGPFDRHLVRGDGDADAAGGVGDALARQAVVGDGEALVDLAQHLVVRHPAVLELELGGVVRGAQRVHDAAHMEARRVGIDDEAGDAGAALGRRRCGRRRCRTARGRRRR